MYHYFSLDLKYRKFQVLCTSLENCRSWSLEKKMHSAQGGTWDLAPSQESPGSPGKLGSSGQAFSQDLKSGPPGDMSP